MSWGISSPQALIAALRIPMRGYEINRGATYAQRFGVTNPHEGL